MPKCYFNSNFTEITLRHGCSPVNMLHIFRTPFFKNTSGWLLLYLMGLVFQNSWHWIQITYIQYSDRMTDKFAVAIFSLPISYFFLKSCAVFNFSRHCNFELNSLRNFLLLLAELLRNSVCDLKFYLRFCLIWNILFIMYFEIFCFTLNNSIAKDCVFLWWTVK